MATLLHVIQHSIELENVHAPAAAEEYARLLRNTVCPHRRCYAPTASGQPGSRTGVSRSSGAAPIMRRSSEIFEYVGFPAFLKPYSGGGWKHVYKVHSPEEFFQHYNQTGDLCMTLQHGVEFKEYFRCYVVGQEKVRIMYYDPRAAIP